MGKRNGGGGGRKPPPFLFSSFTFAKRSCSGRRAPSLPKPPLAPVAPPFTGRGKRKASARLWMRLDRRGGCEVFMCDKAFVAERTGVHARDLRVVGPLLSRSPSILAREKAIVINIEFIRAIVTADEVLLLEPLAHEVLPFVDKLRRHFPLNSLDSDVDSRREEIQDGKHAENGSECELPFEFQVLELALEAVCLSFNSRVADLNRHAISILEDLTKNVSTRNLECLRSMKRNLTSLLAGVHKVRDEVENLLDGNENLAQLHLSRKKLTNSQHQEALLSAASNIMFFSETIMVQPNFVIKQSKEIATSETLDNHEGKLEVLLEAYFMQLGGIRNRIVLVREHIIDTEDYLNIHLDNQRNELIRFRVTLIIASFGIAINTLIAASFGMNMPSNGDRNTAAGSFWPFVGATSSFCLLITSMLYGYAWNNKLLGS